MTELLSPSWWFTFASTALPWYLFCFVASLAALPLTLRLFRGLADRGAGLSIAFGVLATTYFSWLLALEGWGGIEPRAKVLRLFLIALGCVWIAAVTILRRNQEGGSVVRAYAPAGFLFLLGALPLPFGPVSVWVGLGFLAAASAVAWWGDLRGLVRTLRLVAHPWAVAQILFFVAFLFFVNVRSYIPWATFELSLYQAEKWGNYTHLNSIMNSPALPPKDLWFMGEPINYYYGGHLITATLAKATGTPLRQAFNLGIATIFALTIAAGFSFTLGLVHLTSRKVRIFRRGVWHAGLAWGVFGALAIGMFGNLDPLRQIMTRDLDWGVRNRLERDYRVAVEEWKNETGIPPKVAREVFAAATTGTEIERPEAIRGVLMRFAGEEASLRRDLDALITDLDVAVKRLTPQMGDKEVENSLKPLLFSPRARQVLADLPGVNSEELLEDLYRRTLRLETDSLVPALKALPVAESSYQPAARRAADALDAQIEKATKGNAALAALKAELDKPENAAPARQIFGQEATALSDRVGNVLATASYSGAGRLLAELNKPDLRKPENLNQQTLALLKLSEQALAQWRVQPLDAVRAAWGSLPPPPLGELKIDNVRFSLENILFLDFWSPSRSIKSSPPGNLNSGTVTEFPYFSAILGDHHPHHFALPFALLAFSACVSLLRKASRQRMTDRQYFRRCWPELVAMSFLIGAVFPINIWDSVVLAPIYLLVVFFSLLRVEFSEDWRWVGYGGFLLLLFGLLSVPYNSIPGATPLFQNAAFFLLAFALTAIAQPMLQPLFRERALLGAGVFVGLPLVLVYVGGFLAPGTGPQPPFSALIAFRDMVIFLVLATLAAKWSLATTTPTPRWWFGMGATYGLVGAFSLLVFLPFQLFFNSPLQPVVKLFYDFLPPVLSQEITGAPKFWEAFWKASPVNPFDENLRTALRDFLLFWGIFFLPILALAIGRFFRAAVGKPAGVAFLVAMLTLCAMAFGRNYLGWWPGALALGLIVLCFWYARTFRQRAEGPAWVLLIGCFFWIWFVEALHFDDDMGGYLERYNTPFKIYYVIWAPMAGGMVVAVRELLGRFRIPQRSPGALIASSDFWALAIVFGLLVPMVLRYAAPAWVGTAVLLGVWIPVAVIFVLCFLAWMTGHGHRPAELAASAANRFVARWPVLLLLLPILALGMHYPIGATATRTRQWQTWPMLDSQEAGLDQRRIYMTRTLDALDHLKEFPTYRQDYKAFTWAEKNIPEGSFVLERTTDDVYSQFGRIATGGGHTTLLCWKHHQHQWRGRTKVAANRLKERYRAELLPPIDITPAFRKVLGPDIAEVIPGQYYDLRVADGTKRMTLLKAMYPNASQDQLFALRRAVERQNMMSDLLFNFRQVVKDIDPSAKIPGEDQLALRLAGPKERLRLLRGYFNKESLMQLYQLRRVIEQNDVTMFNIMDLMMAHSNAMYQSDDKGFVQELFARYSVDYVVVGELERKAFPNALRRFQEWGFEVVFDSTEEKHRLPLERGIIDKPTYILKAPAGFAKEASAP